MKRPKEEDYIDYMRSDDGEIIVTDSESYKEDLEEYADHLEEEIERLKAERVGLVRYCLSIVLDTTVFHEAHLLNNPDKIIEQFNKEK